MVELVLLNPMPLELEGLPVKLREACRDLLGSAPDTSPSDLWLKYTQAISSVVKDDIEKFEGLKREVLLLRDSGADRKSVV